MARNPIPLFVPCHRVLAAGGLLGGFSAPQGLDMKRRLLALEAAHLARGF
jgi:methylated-DNA-[protein]-cysteine S-methyltransferase